MNKLKFWKKDDFRADLGLDSSDFSFGDSKDPLNAPPGFDSSTNDPLSTGLESPPGFDNSDSLSSGPLSGSALNSSNPSQTSFNQNQSTALPPPPGLGSQPGFANTQSPMSHYPNQFSQQSSPQGFSSQPQNPSRIENSHQGGDAYIVGKEIEIMSSKLDALRAAIDTINQRLSNIERLAENDQFRNSKYRW